MFLMHLLGNLMHNAFAILKYFLKGNLNHEVRWRAWPTAQPRSFSQSFPLNAAFRDLQIPIVLRPPRHSLSATRRASLASLMTGICLSWSLTILSGPPSHSPCLESQRDSNASHHWFDCVVSSAQIVFRSELFEKTGSLRT